MIQMMPKKKMLKKSGRELRYVPVPIEKLREWSERLRKYSDALLDAYTLAEKHGIAMVAVDGGMGFDKHVERVRDVMSEASGDIRGKCIDAM